MVTLARDEILLLFDVDGTLTKPQCAIQPDFEQFLYEKIKPLATIGIVGGSDLGKMLKYLNGSKIYKQFDYIFPENGLIQIENGIEVGRQSIQQHLGEETLQRFINFVLRYLSDIKLPFKRGTFVDFRNGMLNLCPVGRQCTQEERDFFGEYDKKHRIREQMIEALRKEFSDVDLTYSIGGQISLDVFPRGWDKTFALRHFTKTGKTYREIHFFGDKTDPGGNDYEIYSDARTIGHKVNSPDDTKRILSEMFNIQ